MSATSQTLQSRRESRSFLASLRRSEHLVLGSILLVVVLVIATTEPLFLSSRNVANMGAATAALAILCAGQIFVILNGGIDISVAAQIGILSIVSVILSGHLPFPLVFAAVVLIGAGIGLVNGVMVAWIGISPIITTVAMLQVLSGLALVLTQGQPRRNFDPSYTALGTTNVLGVPASVVVAIVVVVLAGLILTRTTLGRYTYAIGGNSDAAFLSGINVRMTTMLNYVLCSAFTAVAAVTLSSRTGSGLPDLGSGLEITTIAAIFIGGIAWGGGKGSIIGVVLGVLLVGVINNGLDLNSVDSNVQTIVIGVLMAVAVGISVLRKRGRRG
jgi:ribose transport system permease protein